MARKRKATARKRKPAPRTGARKATRRAPARKKAAARRKTAAAAPRIPYRNVTPYLAVSDAAGAIEWYKRAFGAKELMRMPGPGGKIMHAEIMIGDSRVMLSDAFPQSDVQDPRTVGGTTANMHVYVRNVDKLWQQALAAGARVVMPLDDQFWGDRYGKLTDPFGHSWALSFKAKMTKEEMERKQREAMAAMGAGAQP
jgi:PhnB protein